jgi:hypothetical protein
MRKLQTLRCRGALGALLLVALASCALWAAAGAAAQSGRRRTPPPPPTAQPSPEGESESESQPRPAVKDTSALASFVVMELDELAFGADNIMRAEVVESFAARLRRAPSISVAGGGRGSRSDARTRAKAESTAYVVLVAVEDVYGGGGGSGPRGSQQERNRSLSVRISVFEPKTGALKYTDTIHQRPVRATVGVGGIGLPVPTRTISRYPAQLELRQAAHDAADRLLSRFKIAAPPEQP